MINDDGQLTREERETQETYRRIAPHWAAKHGDLDFWRSEFVDNFRSLLPSGRIIDIGCGAGRDARLFIDAGYDYTGVDISEALLKEAKQRVPEGTFLHMSMYRLDFPDHHFDGFWACASLLHLPKHRVSQALQEIHRIVRGGAVGFISLKEGSGEGFDDAHGRDNRRFFAYYNDEEFHHTLSANNFEVVKFDRKKRNEETTWLVYVVRAIEARAK